MKPRWRERLSRPSRSTAIVLAVLVVDLLVLFTVPCPHAFSAAVPGNSQVSLGVPSGTRVDVTIRWYQPQGGFVSGVFLLNGPSLNRAKTVLNGTGSQGVFSFTTNSGQWWFLDSSGNPIYYSVSYYAPLL